MFFEINLPLVAPNHIKNEEFRTRMSITLQRVHRRMRLLENALQESGLRGEVFSAGIRKMFNTEEEKPKLDTMTASEIAQAAKLLAPNSSTVPNRFEWPNAVTVVDTAFVTRHEWETIRALSIGGSDSAVVEGISPYRTRLDLYYDKTGAEKMVDDHDPGKSFIFSYGHKVEPLVIEEFCRRTGAKVIPETRMFSKKGMPYMTANIDAITQLPGGEIYVFEAKTTTFFNKDAWAGGSVPIQYVPQCRQYPAVLDDPRVKGTYIGCIYGNTPDDFKCSYVEFNKDAVEMQIEEIRDFWENNIVAGCKPELSGYPDRDVETMRMFEFGEADTEAEPIELDEGFRTDVEHWLEYDRQYKEQKGKADALKAQRDACAVPLIAELGDVTHAILPADDEKYIDVSYTPRSRTSVDTERMRLAYPDAYADCVTVNNESSRVFAIKTKRVRAMKK